MPETANEPAPELLSELVPEAKYTPRLDVLAPVTARFPEESTRLAEVSSQTPVPEAAVPMIVTGPEVVTVTPAAR